MKSFAATALALAGIAQGQNLLADSGIVGGGHKKYHSKLFNRIDRAIHEVTDVVEDLRDIATSTKVEKNGFGCLVEESVFPRKRVEKTITAPLTPFHMDYAQQEAHLRNAAALHKKKLA